MPRPKTLYILRQKLILFLILSASLTSCNSDKKQISDNDILKIKTTLENLALDNLKDWEPPFNDELIQINKYLTFIEQSNWV